MYVVDLVLIIHCVFHAMRIKAWSPNIAVHPELLLRAKREIPFDELNTFFQRQSGCRGDQQMDMSRHHDKRMQQELALAPVRAKYVNKQMLHAIRLEDASASSGRRRDGKCAV